MNPMNTVPAIQTPAAGQPLSGVLAANKVIRNTYLLLSMTLGFSALTAAVTMTMKLPHPGMLLTLTGYFGLLFLTTRFRDQAGGH